MLGEHRHEAEDQRELMVVASGKVKTYCPLADDFRLGYLGIIGAIIGTAFIPQKFPRKDDILRGDRRAVGEASGRIEVENDVAALGVRFHRARDQAIEAERLVVSARHQTFDHVAAHGWRCDSLDDEWVEAVESAEHALHKAAALWRGGVGIREPGEVLGHCQLAVHGDAITPFPGSRARVEAAPHQKHEQKGAVRCPSA